MYELTIKSDFAASHFIRKHPGKCKRMHGHTWKVEVSIVGSRLNKLGMVIDFKEIKSELEDFLEVLDHTNLNDLPFFKKCNPTTENLAKYIFNGLKKRCRPLTIKKVTVWESDRTSVSYSHS